MATADPIRVSWTINFRDGEGTFEIARAEWNAMTPAQREETIGEMFDVEMSNHSYGGWDVDNANLDDPTTEG
jgi:hypothetical protein